jgi:GNAT superfamily N-acetyltransferase
MRPELVLAALSDIDLLVEFSRNLYEADPVATGGAAFVEEKVRATLTDLLTDPSLGWVWLVKSGQESIGYVVITLGYSLEYHGRDAIIDELYVIDEYRGLGIGTWVVGYVEGKARDLGINALHLEVERTNTRARLLYEKLGYQDQDRYLMTKRLSQDDI